MDTTSLPDVLVYGMPVAALAPIVVQGLKNLGLPVQWTGVASITVAFLLLLIAGAATNQYQPDDIIKYVVAAVAYGLAGSGIYSQTKMLAG